MNSSKKTLKATLVMVMALLLLMQAILPMSVMGSNKDSVSDYQYYSVKSGDTLTRIARTFGVTVSDIMTANNMSNSNKIITGAVLKVPLSSSTSNTSGALVTTNLSLNVVDASVKDVLTAIAMNAGYTVIFTGDATKKLTLKLDQMSALKAIDYVTRLTGITYLKDGNTLMVGSAQELNTTFVDKTVFSKFSLKYITTDALMSQAAALGLASVQVIKTDENKRELYLSAYPKELAKINELINLLDVSTNIMPGSTLITSNFTSLELTHIKADELNSLLSELGLGQGIVMASRPYSLFVYVTGKALADIKTIKSIVDVPLSGANLEAETKPDTTKNPETTTQNPNIPAEPTTSGGGSGTPTTPETPENRIFKKITFSNIDMEFAKQIFTNIDSKAVFYNDGKMTKAFWVYSTAEAVQKAEAQIADIDSQTDSLEQSFFTYTLKNCTAGEMLARLSKLELEGVTFKDDEYASTSKTLLIYCSFSMRDYLQKTIKRMDEEIVTDEAQWRALESADSAATCSTRIDTLRTLYPTVIPVASEFQYKSVLDKTGNAKFVTYVFATPEKCNQIKALLEIMDGI
ncbi:MAG: LysM peptidoglycan-binding domain-containing protein [Oscillospiraceae bacterium]